MSKLSPRPFAPARSGVRSSSSFCALVGAAALGLAGCAMPEDELEVTSQAGLAFNGLAFNGLAFNGLAFNGLAFNGLAFNGLAFNGLAFNGAQGEQFANWFNYEDSGDIAFHSNTMKYLIRCAMDADKTVSFTDKNGVTHSWPGAFGLAPSWEESAPTDEQKRAVSACLLAHVNNALPAPKSIQVSLRGDAPALLGGSLEKAALSTFDGVFFGDIFGTSQKRYICSPTTNPPANYLQTLLSDWGRQCVFSPDGCNGFFTRVDCNTACTAPPAGADYLFGPTCTVDGVSYKAINAYVPRFKKAMDWTRVGVQLVSCTGCLDGRVLDNFSSSSYAQAGGWLGNGSSGPVLLDVRYQNATTAAKNLRLQVNGAYVMNGSSQNWSFPPTGSAWAVRTIPVTLSATATVKLMGPTSGKGPKVEVISLRLP